MYAADLFKALALPYKGHRSKAGSQNMARISRGLKPGKSQAGRQFNASRLGGFSAALSDRSQPRIREAMRGGVAGSS